MPNFPTLPDGIYDGMPMEGYLSLPRLSASGCTDLLDRCPAVFRWKQDHPDPQEYSVAAAIGSGLHMMVLEPQRWAESVVVVDAADWRTKAAQEARAAALADGRLPLLPAHVDTVTAMAEAVKRAIGPLPPGTAERTYLWTARPWNVPFRSRPDWACDGGLLLDFKTTGCAAPGAFVRRVLDNGHHLQAAACLEAHAALTGRRAGWIWIVQETDPPYVVQLYEPTETALSIGRERLREACALYAACVAEDKWPAYADGTLPLDLPGYAVTQHEERKALAHARDVEAARRGGAPPPTLLRIAAAWQAPHGNA